MTHNDTQSTTSSQETQHFERAETLTDGDLPDDWGDEDIAFLAKFLADNNLGRFSRILDPESQFDYSLYVPVDATEPEDADDDESPDPFDIGNVPSVGSNIDIPSPRQSGASGTATGRRPMGGDSDE